MSLSTLDQVHDGLAGDAGGYMAHHAGDGLSLSVAVLMSGVYTSPCHTLTGIDNLLGA